MKKIFALITLPLLFAGCQSEDELYTTTVRIKSEPEGAVIVVNNFRLGKTPVSVEFEATENGHFIKKNSITALPQAPELYTQMITFPAFSPSNPDASKAPKEITFIMTKTPQEEGGAVTK